MTADSNRWVAARGLELILEKYAEPLQALASGQTPALVMPQVFPTTECAALVDRLVAGGYLYDPGQPAPDEFRDASVPEGYYHPGPGAARASAPTQADTSERRRIDIGTSLGNRGADSSAFFAHSRQTKELFSRLFSAAPNPIQTLYDNLQRLSLSKRVVTAHEPDGREYGPAIIRAHYGGYSYAPHFDSVRLREKRESYAVSAFEHQFAGVLVLQNSRRGQDSAQCILHRCLWEPEMDHHIRDGTFHDYASQQSIENVRVELEPGDLYFFNTRCIHEVPGIAGDLPRVVLATFIGYSSDRDEVFVWS